MIMEVHCCGIQFKTKKIKFCVRYKGCNYRKTYATVRYKVTILEQAFIDKSRWFMCDINHYKNVFINQLKQNPSDFGR